MIRDAVLALGLLLSTASQFRIPAIPLGLGPGEVLLAIWILVTLPHMAFYRNPAISPAIARLLLFWTAFAMAQSLGEFVGLAMEHVRDTAGARRTAQAYLLSAVLSCLLAAETAERLRRTTWMMAGAGAVFLSALVAGGYGALPVPGIHLWVFRRFVGWSTNPNQFALICTVLVLLSLHLAETETRLYRQFLALFCAVPAFAGGVLTKSDSFILAVLIAGPMLIGTKLLHWGFVDEPRQRLRSMLACLTLFSIVAALVSAAPFASKILEKAQDSAVATMQQNDQAEGRFRLWRDAVDVGLDAGMLGLGPGPHLVSKQWKLPPPLKNEAHNTLLDLLTQGGLLAAASFVWITATSLFTAYRAGLIALAALVFSLFVFSNFHLVARHPTFWFSIVFCLTAADAAREANTGRAATQRERALRPLPSHLT